MSPGEGVNQSISGAGFKRDRVWDKRAASTRRFRCQGCYQLTWGRIQGL